MNRLIALAAICLMTTNSLAAKLWDEPASAPQFKGTLTGQVKWKPKHTSNWFVFVVKEANATNGSNSQFKDIQGKSVQVAVGKWIAPDKPAPERVAFIEALQPKQALTISVRGTSRKTFDLTALPDTVKPTNVHQAPQSRQHASPQSKGLHYPVRRATGALIDETVVATTLHVNPAKAHAMADGTRANPYPTLTAGLMAAEKRLTAGIATKVIVHPGVYREGPISLQCGKGKAQDTLLIIEGTDAASCILSGSDIYPASEWTELGNGLYAAHWPHDWGHFTYNWGPPKPLGHRREMVFVDGELFTHVELEHYKYNRDPDLFKNPKRRYDYMNASPPTALKPGEFGVAERDENGNKLYVRLKQGQSIDQVTIEVAQRRQLLIIGPKKNMVIRNITFTHAANDFQNYARHGALTLHDQTENVLLDRTHFVWNNFAGLRLPGGNHFTLRNVVASYNGYGGIGNGAKNMLVVDSITNFNNWRGHLGGQYGWNLGGVKIGGHHGPITFIRHTAVGNLSGGLWTDIHPFDVIFEECVSALNYGFGLFFELSNGPHLADRCMLVHNRSKQFNLSITGKSMVRNSVLYGNTKLPQGKLGLPMAVAHMQWYLRKDNHAKMHPLKAELAALEGNVIAGGQDQLVLISFQNGVNRANPNYASWELYMKGNTLHGPNNEAYIYNDKDWGQHIIQWPAFKHALNLGENTLADPQFMNPNRLDFRVKGASPLVARRQELPLKQLDASWLDETRAWYKRWGLEGPRVLAD